MTGASSDRVRAAPTGGLAGAAGRLWCLVGHHAPGGDVVWHQGYGFAHCRRCKQAIVRSLLSDWTVPGPGLRIVWDKASNRPAPPADSPQPVVIAAVAPPREVPVASPVGWVEPRRPVQAAAERVQVVVEPVQAVVEPIEPAREPVQRVVPVAAPVPAPMPVEAAVTEPRHEPVPVAEEPQVEERAETPEAAVEREPAPLLSVLEPEPAPFDLLGPNFMGDQEAPPPPRQGPSVFAFDDMGSDDDGMGFGIAAQSGR